MFIKEIRFECYQNTQYAAVERAINNYFDMLRYNGQILGREFPVAMFASWFVVRLVCPEENSLHDKFNSQQVKQALDGLTAAGLLAPKIKTIGEDLNSLECASHFKPSWQLLYTTFLDTCSPLRCGETLAPIPLYRTAEAISNGDRKSVIKWQEEWINCDELQMNGSAVSSVALQELGDVDSRLYHRGSELCKRIEGITHVPTYYYLYRVAGKSLQEEQQRKCPCCGGEWKLDSPLFDIFDFKCDSCQLVSNLSWDFKK
ncbi:Zn-ribbon-containing protein [Psychromonas antarctica]|jgi:predicted  nucleic acid-binding Zn ribbon protein|uniref:Zn-ribbon-containing protein n=1 Tax=Psychromonas antarctica TaxID=67573 RepID=UPI001EE790B8|nr:Zn-ribbon-containing protein [Psychromonas antarctica]MCG6201274.1 Zn-ribbon-containing protein [Psychromonas antarctica]